MNIEDLETEIKQILDQNELETYFCMDSAGISCHINIDGCYLAFDYSRQWNRVHKDVGHGDSGLDFKYFGEFIEKQKQMYLLALMVEPKLDQLWELYLKSENVV